MTHRERGGGLVTVGQSGFDPRRSTTGDIAD